MAPKRGAKQNTTESIVDSELTATAVDNDSIMEQSESASAAVAASASAVPAAPAAPTEESIKNDLASILQELSDCKSDLALMNSIAASAAAGKQSRLMITQLTVENFKSYSGIHTIGPFHSRFSSVVGPNGSGKSNVIDALLFVFGFKASDMRQGKLIDLIHKSSGKSYTDCSVTIHFQLIDDIPNSEDYTVRPNSQFTIKHTVNTRTNKLGDSKYYINNKSTAVTRNRVRDELRQYGIDIDNNRFLILQGQVEQISLMPPTATKAGEEGILQYLENIIGTDRLVAPIERINTIVDSLNEQRQLELNRVKLSESDLNHLKPAMLEAVDYIEKQYELQSKQSALYQFNLAQLTVAIDNDNQLKAECNSKLESEKLKLQSTETELIRLESEFKSAELDYSNTAEILKKLKSDFNEFEQLDTEQKEKLKSKLELEPKLNKKLSKLQSEYNDKSTELKSNESNIIPTLKSKLIELSSRKESAELKLESIFNQLKAKTEPIRISINTEQQKLIPLKQKINGENQLLSDYRAELELIQQKSNIIKQQQLQNEEKLNNVDKEITTIKSQYNTNQQKSTESSSRLLTIETELKQLDSDESRSQQRKSQLEALIDESKSTQSAETSKNAVLNGLIKAKIGGFYGRLGDLACIDSKYDCAITTACGQLNFLVVQSVESAQKCIDYLKVNQLGRASFIVLDKLDSQLNAKLAAVFTSPSTDAARLFDLITIANERFKIAFYFALRDTLVCSNLDLATKIAYSTAADGSIKRYRVVTLDGKLIELAGTMSGGGNTVSKGGMSNKLKNNPILASSGIVSKSTNIETSVIDIKQLAIWESDRKSIENQLLAFKSQRKSLETELKSLKSTINESELSMKKLTIKLKTLTESRIEIEKRINKLSTEYQDTLNSEQYKSRTTELQSLIIKQEKSVLLAKSSTAELESIISKLESKIMDAGGIELKSQQSELDSINSNIDATQTELNKLTVSNSTGSKLLKKLEKSLNEINNEIKENTAIITTLTAEIKVNKDLIIELTNEFKLKQSELKQRETELDEITKEYYSIRTTVDSAKLIEAEILNKLDDIEKQLKDHNNKYKHWQNQFNLVSKKIEQSIQLLTSAQNAANGNNNNNNNSNNNPIPSITSHLLSTEELLSKSFKKGDYDYSITMLEDLLSSMKPNMRAIEEYQLKELDYSNRIAGLDRITLQRDSARKVYETLRQERLELFLSGFTVITMKLKEMYQMLTLGGDAELELVDSLDPFNEGIIFSVRPPKKSWKNIQNLSGGEKTLSSLALVFALHHYKPNPLYIMDEIDAALDFKNVSIVANYIKERTQNAQFIIISLRNNMFELADRLVGIYKTNDCTKSITIDPRQFNVPNGDNSRSNIVSEQEKLESQKLQAKTQLTVV